MNTVREQWTDERLDDLREGMREGFSRVDAEMRDLRADLRGIRGEMAANHRAILQLTVGTIATMVAGFLGLIATQL